MAFIDTGESAEPLFHTYVIYTVEERSRVGERARVDGRYDDEIGIQNRLASSPAPVRSLHHLSVGEQRRPIADLPSSCLSIPCRMVGQIAILSAVLFGFGQITIRAEDGFVFGLKRFARDLEEHSTAALFVQAFGHENEQVFARGEAAEIDLPFSSEETKGAIAKKHSWLPAQPLPHVVRGNSRQRGVRGVDANARGEALETLVAGLRLCVFALVHGWYPFSSQKMVGIGSSQERGKKHSYRFFTPLPTPSMRRGLAAWVHQGTFHVHTRESQTRAGTHTC